MTDLFTESDFTDAGGYNLNARYIVEKVNERIKKIAYERDGAIELLKLAAGSMREKSDLLFEGINNWLLKNDLSRRQEKNNEKDRI